MTGRKRITVKPLPLPVTGEYTRELEGVTTRMIEVEPGWYVNAEVWRTLQRVGYTHCSKQEETV